MNNQASIQNIECILSSPRDPYGPHLIVIVGQSGGEGVFRCSASLLCHYSGYFSLITTSPFFNAFASEIRLPGDSAEIFGMVHFYLQFRRFCPVMTMGSIAGEGVSGETKEVALPPEASVLTFDKIVEIYEFGVRRNVPLVQNAATDLFAEKIKVDGCLPDVWSVEFLWEKTAPGAALRRLMVDLVREMWIPEAYRHPVWKELVGGMSETPERLIEAIDGLLASRHQVRVSPKTTRRLQACEWHVHEGGVVCEGSEEARLPMLGDGEFGPRERKRKGSWSFWPKY